MLIRLPPVKSFDVNVPSLGRIQQILVAVSEVSGSAVPFTKEKYKGHLLTVDGEGEGAPIFLFASPPAKCTFSPDARVLVAKYEMTSAESLDLIDGRWWHHPVKSSALGVIGDREAQARVSWHGAFRFSEEDTGAGQIGLRTPQIGALHAILAHWSISTETATIVMPTGIGKTETMLSTLISATCEKLLVIVPTDALRTQIARKFETLGILKTPGSKILDDAAHRPVVGTLKSRPKSIEEVATFFNQCNVIVATSQLVGGCASEVQARMCDLCSHLFIDEAHHSEASTWKAFRGRFNGKPVLQFTATPFREDGRKIEGKLIYVYPLRKAQAEGYFGAIRFRDVYEFDPIEGDRAIASAAMEEIEADTTRKHIVMARVGNTVRANEILALYQSLGGCQAVAIHSGLTQRERDCAKAKLFDGSARIVVCVDMLGEGFDLPELKIAAFHDIRKSLSVTLQLAGRFTRARADLGEPVFIANTARIDVREELRKLYTQDPDWNLLLPELSASAIDDEVASQHFFQGFDTAISEVPIKDIRPAASMVVYKTRCANWKPAAFRRGLPTVSRGSNVFYSVNHDERTLIILATSERPVRWTDVESVFDWSWELFLAVWDKEKSLLYVHGSNNSGSYRELAKVLCGNDVQLIMAPDIYRCFHNIKRLVLNNVGLDEHLGRNVRYTGRMGTDVEAQIGSSARRGAIKAVLAGKGFENGGKTSIGSAKRGRIWSTQRLRVDTFAQWAKLVGEKLIDDTIDPDEVLKGTLKPLAIGELPQKVVIAIDWPWEVLDRPESGTYFTPTGRQEEPLTCVDIAPSEREAPVYGVVRVFGEDWESHLQLELSRVEGGFDFLFSYIGGSRVSVRRGQVCEGLDEYLTRAPPTIWYADGSSLEGCNYVELPLDTLMPFPSERLVPIDWSGVDIQKESQGEQRRSGTVQRRIIEMLLENTSYEVVFDDDGSGEAADIVTIALSDLDGRTRIDVDLYHCKFSGAVNSGSRVDDLYVVCGQAQRSIKWLSSHESRTGLFMHLLEREAQRRSRQRATRFERGDLRRLGQIKDMSRQCEVSLKVHVVQPGISKARVSERQLQLLAVTERYLTDTFAVPLNVICSS